MKTVNPNEFRLKKNGLSIGRHSENDLSISEPSVSRQHASIENFNDEFIVSDCSSSYGTKLNGEKLIESVSLRNGDVLVLGNSFEIKAEIVFAKKEETEKTEEETESSAGNFLPAQA